MHRPRTSYELLIAPLLADATEPLGLLASNRNTTSDLAHALAENEYPVKFAWLKMTDRDPTPERTDFTPHNDQYVIHYDFGSVSASPL